MTCRQSVRRPAPGVVLAFSVAPAWAAAAPAARPTVYRDVDGRPYVLRGPDERQYLSASNVTWIDKDHVPTPQGIGGFE